MTELPAVCRDEKRWKALAKFANASIPKQGLDPRIGMIMLACWQNGYDAGIKRSSRKGKDT